MEVSTYGPVPTAWLDSQVWPWSFPADAGSVNTFGLAMPVPHSAATTRSKCGTDLPRSNRTVIGSTTTICLSGSVMNDPRISCVPSAILMVRV